MRAKTKSEVPIGTLLSERYRITREIGRGGMAAVYEAEHVEIGKRVAVKVLDSSLAHSAVLIERFHREARAAASVNSPHICEVFDVGRLDDGRPYLVMELLRGESLYDRMCALRRLSRTEVVTVFAQVARGLARAHDAGIVHRDLKPENVFLACDVDGEETVKLLDFGLAKFHTIVGDREVNPRLTREGAIFGTPLYMSPEQVSGQGNADVRSDLWALGCMVVECLLGQPVWRVDQGMAIIFAQIASAPIPVPSTLRPDLPRAFDVWTARALHRNPDERFQNAREMVHELSLALGHDPAGLTSSPVLNATPVAAARVPVSTADDPGPHRADPSAYASTQPPPPLASHQVLQVRVPSVSDVRSALTSETGTAAPLRRMAPTQPAARRRPRALVPLLFAGAVAGLALSAFAIWNLANVDPPAPAEPPAPPPSGAPPSAAVASPPTPPSAAPVASETAWPDDIARAQRLVHEGKMHAAIQVYQRAREKSDDGALVMLLEHTRLAASAAGPCKVADLGRPRPLGRPDAVRYASVVDGPRGPLVAWVDDHGTLGRMHLSTSRLDATLRRATDPVDVTPFAREVHDPQLLRVGDRLAVLYADRSPRAAGVYVQALDADGAAIGHAIRVSASRASVVRPQATVDADGRLWVAYTDVASYRYADTFLQRLDERLRPEGEAIQVTHVDRAAARGMAAPALSTIHGDFALALRLENARENDILIHWVQREPKGLRVPSEPITLTERRLKVGAPSIACSGEECFVTWRNRPNGTQMVAVERATGRVLWRNTIAASGTEAVVATDRAGEVLLAWFDAGRVRVAPLRDNQLAPESAIGRVHGEQPAPSLTPTSSKGEWLLGWTCFEGGRPELYVVRLRCEP